MPDPAPGSDLPSSSRQVTVQRRVLVAAILGAGIVFLDSSVAGVALPAIQRDLGISTSLQQWVVSAYLLTLSALLIVGGRLGDLYGRKKMLVVGLWGYVVLASLAGLAPSGIALVAIRALQGVVGAVLTPTTLALINANFSPAERGKAIGTWAAWSGITSLFGPIIGGLAIDNLSWRFAFLVTPPLAAVAIFVARGIPESTDRAASRDLDLPGALLVVLGLAGVVYALITVPGAGWSSPAVLGSAAAGVAALALFAWWEARAANPLMPYAMFANRDLAVANVVTLFVYAGLYGAFFYVPIYVQSSLGASATIAGAVFFPVSILLFLLSPVAGRLNDRYGPRWLMFVGPLVAAAGVAVSGMASQGQLWRVLVPGIVLFGVGLGFTVVPVTATAIGAAEERFSGIASGFNNAVSRVAGMLAIALMGVVVVQLWQTALGPVSTRLPAPAAAALGAVADRAFVTPDLDTLSTSDADSVRALVNAASAEAFSRGMLLAAGLIALGGITSAVGIRRRP